MSVSAKYSFLLEVAEDLEEALSEDDGEIVTHLVRKIENLSGTTLVPVTKVWAQERTIGTWDLGEFSGTRDAIYLSLLPSVNGITDSADGLRPQLVMILADQTNAMAIRFTSDLMGDPYPLLGTGWSFTLEPGNCIMFRLDSAADVIVSSNNDEIGVHGPYSALANDGDKYRIIILFG